MVHYHFPQKYACEFHVKGILIRFCISTFYSLDLVVIFKLHNFRVILLRTFPEITRMDFGDYGNRVSNLSDGRIISVELTGFT